MNSANYLGTDSSGLYVTPGAQNSAQQQASANLARQNSYPVQTTNPNVPGYTDAEHQASARALNPSSFAAPQNPTVITSTPAQKFVSTAQGTLNTATNNMAMQSQQRALTPSGDIALSQSGTYGVDSVGDVYNTTNGQHVDLPEFKSLGLNVDLLPKIPTPGGSQGQSALNAQAGGTPQAPSGSPESAPGSTIQPASTPDPFTAQILKNEQQSDDAYQTFQNTIQQAQTGVFPLSPDQAAILDSLRSQTEALVRQQQQQNKALMQGTKVLQQRQGISGTLTALNTINAVVSGGLQKINDLEVKAAGAIAELREGFTKNNLALVSESYNAFQKYMDKKDATIRDMRDTASAAIKDARDFEFKQTQADIENNMALDKFDYAKSQDEINNAFTQQKIDLDQKQFLEQKLNNQRNYNLAARKFQNELDQQAAGGDQSLIIAAEEYAGTGKMPSWVTKEDAAKIAIISKTIAQPAGRLVDAITGMPRASTNATRENSIIALNDALKNLDIMKQAFGEFHQGLVGPLGSLMPSDARVIYDTTKADFLSKLLLARSGAAVSEQEYKRLADLVPGDFNKSLWLGTDGSKKLDTLKTSLKSALDTSLATDGLRITNANVTNADATQQLQALSASSPESADRIRQIISENPNYTAEDVWQILHP